MSNGLKCSELFLVASNGERCIVFVVVVALGRTGSRAYRRAGRRKHEIESDAARHRPGTGAAGGRPGCAPPRRRHGANKNCLYGIMAR